MPISFASTTGREHGTVTVNATALSASTVYVASITNPSGHTQKVEFTTDGTGAATFSFVPQGGGKGSYSLSAVPKNPTTTASSNTFSGV